MAQIAEEFKEAVKAWTVSQARMFIMNATLIAQSDPSTSGNSAAMAPGAPPAVSGATLVTWWISQEPQHYNSWLPLLTLPWLDGTNERAAELDRYLIRLQSVSAQPVVLWDYLNHLQKHWQEFRHVLASIPIVYDDDITEFELSQCDELARCLRECLEEGPTNVGYTDEVKVLVQDTLLRGVSDELQQRTLCLLGKIRDKASEKRSGIARSVIHNLIKEETWKDATKRHEEMRKQNVGMGAWSNSSHSGQAVGVTAGIGAISGVVLFFAALLCPAPMILGTVGLGTFGGATVTFGSVVGGVKAVAYDYQLYLPALDDVLNTQSREDAPLL
eukprot:TRINITY_DN5954_c0_g1_i1.p1 TRINITY_DN5954_c0_g1~~TRINITY_DN5954_c0_g1_i1.p1  ORF type:complete len:330 (+),score=28.57 TRINITY_DN5954_c0_g1_i1:92-1081(+)